MAELPTMALMATFVWQSTVLCLRFGKRVASGGKSQGTWSYMHFRFRFIIENRLRYEQVVPCG